MTDVATLFERLVEEPLLPVPPVEDLQRRNRARHRRTATSAASGVVAAAVAAVLVVAFVLPAPAPPGGRGLASYLVPATTVPLNVLETVGVPSAVHPPQAVHGQPLLETAGKPEIFYAGAAFCPYCAVSRWALVVALSEFGSFSNLGSIVSSSSSDVYPGLKSWSFAGSTYTSRYVSFDPVELSFPLAGQPATPGPATGYVPVSALSPADRHLLATVDTGDAVPFIDVAGRDVEIGASADPAPLEGLSLGQISSSLSDPSNPVAQGLDGAANALIATICSLPGAGGAPVCATSLAGNHRASQPATTSAPAAGQGAPPALLQPARWNTRTATVRLRAQGPDGTTLLVGSAAGGGMRCDALAVEQPGGSGATLVGGAACGTVTATGQAPAASAPFPQGSERWRSPTGAPYAVAFGRGPSGTARVAFASRGSAPVTGAVDQGWYAIAVPYGLAKTGAVRFYSSTGKILGQAPDGAAP